MKMYIHLHPFLVLTMRFTFPGYPLRRKYPKAASERLTIPSESADVIEAPFQDYGFSDQHEEVSTSLKRLLPDRSHATHDRANKKLVHFIVKQRMVEGRLLV